MDGNFVNLARVDPSNFVTIKNGVKGKRLCNTGGGTGGNTVSSICISLVKVTECHIAEPTVTNGGQIIKQISGLHHSLENERLQSFCCVVFGAPGMQAPIRDGVLTFGTRPEKPGQHFISATNLDSLTPSSLCGRRCIYSDVSHQASGSPNRGYLQGP